MKRKGLHNFLLFLLTVLAVLVLIAYKGLDSFPVVAIACFVYLGWAVAYHKIDKSLTLAVILEYVLTATLVLILLSGFLV